MLILGVTTSTRRGSVALLDGETLVASEAYEASDGHAERLFGAIDRVLAEAGVQKRSVGLIGCDIGPGSFTGVRAGVAAMQGAAKALRIPVVGVTSLEAMAMAARRLGHDRALCLIDAKKAEVFYALYTPEHSVAPSHVSIAEVETLVELRSRHGVLVFGEVAEGLVGLEPLRGPALDLPDAELIARVAAAVPRPATTAILEPLYVRAPNAKPASTELVPAVRTDDSRASGGSAPPGR